MVLDAIVDDPDLVWLGTAEETASHLTRLTRIEPANLAHVVLGEADSRIVRYFPDPLIPSQHLDSRASFARGNGMARRLSRPAVLARSTTTYRPARAV
jgi:hypothetical protein